jgi:hypothetical protein
MPTLWGGGGLGACPENVPGIGEPKEKELCAGSPALLDHDDEPSGCGAVLQGGLQLGPPASVDALTTTTTTTTCFPFFLPSLSSASTTTTTFQSPSNPFLAKSSPLKT